MLSLRLHCAGLVASWDAGAGVRVTDSLSRVWYRVLQTLCLCGEGVAEWKGAEADRRYLQGARQHHSYPYLCIFLSVSHLRTWRAVCEAETPAMLQITWRPVSEHLFSLCGSPSLPSHPFDVKRAGVSSAPRSRSRPVASVVHLSLSGVFGEGEELRGVEK